MEADKLKINSNNNSQKDSWEFEIIDNRNNPNEEYDLGTTCKIKILLSESNGGYGLIYDKRCILPPSYDFIYIHKMSDNGIGNFMFDDYIDLIVLASKKGIKELFHLEISAKFQEDLKLDIIKIASQSYDKISWHEYSSKIPYYNYGFFLIVQNKGLLGICTIQNKQLITLATCEYDDIHTRPDSHIIILKKKRKIYLLNIIKHTRPCLITGCDDISDFKTQFRGNKYAIVTKKGKYGLMKEDGTLLIKPIFDKLLLCDKSSSLILTKAEKKYVYSLLLEKEPVKIDDFSNIGSFNICINGVHYAQVFKTRKCGLLREDGKTMIEPKYEYIHEFKHKFRNKLPFLAYTSDGFPIDINGRPYGIFSNDYPKVFYIATNRFLAQNITGKWGIIDDKLNIICDFIYDDYYLKVQLYVRQPKYKSLIMCVNNKEVLVTVRSGKKRSSQFDHIEWKSTKYLIVKDNNKYGVINEKGKLIIPLLYDHLSGIITWGHGISVEHACLNGKSGSIKNGEFVQPLKRHKFGCSEDSPTYDRYHGSYAQDTMGYSDDDIDTIFDGDPDAYWNID